MYIICWIDKLNFVINKISKSGIKNVFLFSYSVFVILKDLKCLESAHIVVLFIYAIICFFFCNFLLGILNIFGYGGHYIAYIYIFHLAWGHHIQIFLNEMLGDSSYHDAKIEIFMCCIANRYP